MEENKSGSMLSKVVIAGVVATMVTGGLVMAKNQQPKTQPAQEKQMMKLSYKDGEYSEMGGYTSPAGPEEIGVKLSIKDDVITAVTIEPKATHEFSVKWQGVFRDNVATAVVGKKLSEINLDKVAGSSLTPKGFNQALEKIKNQAKT